MTGEKTAHITVTYRDGGDEIIRIYAVNEEISRELDRRIQKPTGKDLRVWLETKGCQLDLSGGPAYVRRFASGTLVEEYYRDGKRHREDGPAVVWRFTDGSTVEEYYQGGQRHREGGPAYIGRSTDGTTEEQYYQGGKPHRGPGAYASSTSSITST